MNVNQMRFRCPKAKVMGTAMLKDYKLVFRGNSRGWGVANVEKCKGSEVPVVLWDITKDDEMNLDIYEGFPRLYIKRFLEVQFKERKVKAMAYIMTAGHQKAEPAPSYFYIIYESYKRFGFDLNPLKG